MRIGVGNRQAYAEAWEALWKMLERLEKGGSGEAAIHVHTRMTMVEPRRNHDLYWDREPF